MGKANAVSLPTQKQMIQGYAVAIEHSNNLLNFLRAAKKHNIKLPGLTSMLTLGKTQVAGLTRSHKFVSELKTPEFDSVITANKGTTAAPISKPKRTRAAGGAAASGN